MKLEHPAMNSRLNCCLLSLVALGVAWSAVEGWAASRESMAKSLLPNSDFNQGGSAPAGWTLSGGNGRWVDRQRSRSHRRRQRLQPVAMSVPFDAGRLVPISNASPKHGQRRYLLHFRPRVRQPRSAAVRFLGMAWPRFSRARPSRRRFHSAGAMARRRLVPIRRRAARAGHAGSRGRFACGGQPRDGRCAANYVGRRRVDPRRPLRRLSATFRTRAATTIARC